MPRAIVTPGLAETLRSLRLQNNIQSKQVASLVGKSPAYITKLEKGGIQSIDTQELYLILRFVSGDTAQQELSEQIYKTLQLKYSPKEIEEQLWFINYDTVECLLPIPNALVDELNTRINSLGISRQYLIERINTNEAISDEDRKDSAIPINQWYHPSSNKDNTHSIKISLSLENLNNILDYKKDVAPYVFIYCILFYLLKIEQYQDIVNISDEQYNTLIQKTKSILNSYMFLSISEKNRLLSEKKSQEEINSILNSFDKENIDILNEIISGFKYASQHNIKTTNEQLRAFGNNMHWDLGFMLCLISMNYADLVNTSFSNKKKLLYEIEDLVEKYINLSEDQNRIETYQ